MVNEFLFQTLSSEEDGVCMASGTKPLDKLTLDSGVSVSDRSVLGFGFLKTTPEGLNFLKN